MTQKATIFVPGLNCLYDMAQPNYRLVRHYPKADACVTTSSGPPRTMTFQITLEASAHDQCDRVELRFRSLGYERLQENTQRRTASYLVWALLVRRKER